MSSTFIYNMNTNCLLYVYAQFLLVSIDISDSYYAWVSVDVSHIATVSIIILKVLSLSVSLKFKSVCFDMFLVDKFLST